MVVENTAEGGREHRRGKESSQQRVGEHRRGRERTQERE
jgi:hypothetical protein